MHHCFQVASEDEPQSLADAEQLLNQHAAIREEIDGYAEDYVKVYFYIVFSLRIFFLQSHSHSFFNLEHFILQ